MCRNQKWSTHLKMKQKKETHFYLFLNLQKNINEHVSYYVDSKVSEQNEKNTSYNCLPVSSMLFCEMMLMILS